MNGGTAKREITFILALTLNPRRRLLRTSREGAKMETLPMFRTQIIAALTVALLGGTALAQPANAPPANLPNSARSAPDYDDENGPPPPGYQPGYQNGREQGPPPGYQNGPQQGPAPSAQQAAAERDMFCRRDAAARTGYTTPDQ